MKYIKIKNSRTLKEVLEIIYRTKERIDFEGSEELEHIFLVEFWQFAVLPKNKIRKSWEEISLREYLRERFRHPPILYWIGVKIEDKNDFDTLMSALGAWNPLLVAPVQKDEIGGRKENRISYLERHGNDCLLVNFCNVLWAQEKNLQAEFYLIMSLLGFIKNLKRAVPPAKLLRITTNKQYGAIELINRIRRIGESQGFIIYPDVDYNCDSGVELFLQIDPWGIRISTSSREILQKSYYKEISIQHFLKNTERCLNPFR